MSALTHLAGALLAVVGTGVLVRRALVYGSVWHVVSYAIFGVSLVALYAASTTYHWLRVSERATKVLRRIDHMMIYVLIAGSYTPFSLVPLRGPWGWSLLGTIWGLAIFGLLVTIWWMDAPRWLSTAVYVGMGWLVVSAAGQLILKVPAGGLVWLALGGLFYTVGAVIYAVKKPNPAPGVFGFHEIWHLFVMAGSLSHYWAVLGYLTRMS